jgi:predicted transcriptional regulator
MNVGTICQRLVVHVSRSDEVVRAAQLMRSKHVGYLVVVESENGGALRPVGVLTDRDIVVTVVAPEVDPRTLRVACRS